MWGESFSHFQNKHMLEEGSRAIRGEGRGEMWAWRGLARSVAATIDAAEAPAAVEKPCGAPRTYVYAHAACRMRAAQQPPALRPTATPLHTQAIRPTRCSPLLQARRARGDAGSAYARL